MAFEKDIKKHLSDYKAIHFPKYDNGIWARTGTELYYAFKVPEKGEKNPDSNMNLIGIYQEDFLNYENTLKGKSRIKRHIYFHHMNSSQAMCFNFFYPLLKEKQLNVILSFLGISDDEVDHETACFEKLSTKDNKGQNNYKSRRPTNFDFYFKTKLEKEFFFEIKYTEDGFNKATADEEHVEKYQNVYSHLLTPINENYKTQAAFLENYQIMRNLIHIDKNSYVVFLYPEENKKVKEGADRAEKEILHPNFKEHLFNTHWSDIYAFVQLQIEENIKLKKQFEEFGEKYLIKESQSL